jgi:predicted Zn-dependent protease
MGSAVLPDFISVTFDPTLKEAAGEDLNGWYRFDDEGVKARRVTVVENGMLKTFLMSRTPIPGVEHSNGHGRRQAGLEVVARQSNLLVEPSRQVSEKRLKEMLMEEVKRQNKPYGFYFQEITGGFTNTGRRGIQAFKVIPLVVYRIYPDGREEMVRGADIVGTPLASFAKILAAGDKMEVFNGFCGAESGRVPVSAVSPAILVSELEVQKKESSRDRPPLLAPPPAKPSASGGGL